MVRGANENGDSGGDVGMTKATVAVSALCCLILLVAIFIYGRKGSATIGKLVVSSQAMFIHSYIANS